MSRLAAHEVADYFECLPRNVRIIVGGEEYFANQELVVAFSPVLKRLFSETGDGVVKLEVDDQNHLFNLVIEFLHGKQIDITPSNVLYLKKFADVLEIKPLSSAVQPHIDAETDLENVIPRIIFGDCQKFVPFLMEHIEEVAARDDVYGLPKEVLLSVIRSDESRFSSVDSRYVFALRCAVRVPGFAEELFAKKFTESMPLSVVERVLSDKEFAPLESRLPYLFDVFQTVMNDVTTLQCDINQVRTKLQTEKNLTDEVEERTNVLREANSKEKELLEKIHAQIQQVKSETDRLLATKDQSLIVFSRMIGIATSVEQLEAFDKTVTDIMSQHEKVFRVVNKMKKNKVLYQKTLSSCFELVDTWGKHLGPLKESVSSLTPNNDIIKQIVRSMEGVFEAAKELAEFLNNHCS